MEKKKPKNDGHPAIEVHLEKNELIFNKPK